MHMEYVLAIICMTFCINIDEHSYFGRAVIYSSDLFGCKDIPQIIRIEIRFFDTYCI